MCLREDPASSLQSNLGFWQKCFFEFRITLSGWGGQLRDVSKTHRKWTFQLKTFPTHVETFETNNSRRSYSTLKLIEFREISSNFIKISKNVQNLYRSVQICTVPAQISKKSPKFSNLPTLGTSNSELRWSSKIFFSVLNRKYAEVSIYLIFSTIGMG